VRSPDVFVTNATKITKITTILCTCADYVLDPAGLRVLRVLRAFVRETP